MSALRTTTAGDAFSPIAAKVLPIWRNNAMASSLSARAGFGSVGKNKSIVTIGNIFPILGVIT
jgi:hypothetical protein